MSQPAKNSKLQKKKESTRLDTLFLNIALREHAPPILGLSPLRSGKILTMKMAKSFLIKFNNPTAFSTSSTLALKII